MNILFLSNKSTYFDNQFGGAESSMCLMAKHLAMRNHNVFYCTRIRNKRLTFGLKFLDTEKIQVHAVDFLDRACGVRFVERIRDFFVCYLALRIIKKNNIDIVYCFYELNNLRIATSLKQKYGVKVVMRMAGLDWYERAKEKVSVKNEFSKYFNMVDAVNYIHEELREEVRIKMSELKMKVSFRSGLCCDIGTYTLIQDDHCNDDLKKESRIFTIVMATRFSFYQKRYDILLSAVKMLHDSNDFDFKVTLIGSGPAEEVIKNKILELNLSNIVSVLPFCSQVSLWSEIDRADLYCHSVEYEGLGKVILESMSIGTPVLASNVIPMNKYIEHGKNGFLVDNDPRLWADEIKRLYYSEDERKSVGVNAKKFVEMKYDPCRNVMLYEKFFNKILKLKDSVIVEFVGMSGAGKSFVRKELMGALGNIDIGVKTSRLKIGDMLSFTFCSVFCKSIAFVFLSKPKNFEHFVRGVKKWIRFQLSYTKIRKDYGLYIVEEGVLQKFRALQRYSSLDLSISNVDLRLLKKQNFADLVVYVVANEEQLKVRLLNRDGSISSRFSENYASLSQTETDMKTLQKLNISNYFVIRNIDKGSVNNELEGLVKYMNDNNYIVSEF